LNIIAVFNCFIVWKIELFHGLAQVFFQQKEKRTLFTSFVIKCFHFVLLLTSHDQAASDQNKLG